MSTPKSTPPVKLELDAFLSASRNPASPITSTSDGETTFSADEQHAEAEYRSTKAVYKRAKDVYKQRTAMPEMRANLPSAGEVEAAYRAAKLKYKEAKSAWKALRNAKQASLKDKTPKLESLGISRMPVGFDTTEFITVCGGKTCKRMGADAVAEVMQRETRKGFMMGANVSMNAPCMKQCGGEGPTVRLGTDTVKVDLKKAVLDAINRNGST